MMLRMARHKGCELPLEKRLLDGFLMTLGLKLTALCLLVGQKRQSLGIVSMARRCRINALVK